MKNHKLIMENWRHFLKEEEAKTAAHSPHTLDTPDGIQALIEAYREKSLSKEEAPKVDKKWFKKDPKEKVADDLEVTGLFDTKEGKAVYKYNGDKYEAEVFNYFLKDPKLQPFRGDFNTPAGSDASRADLDFYLPYGDEGERVGPIKVEMKLNPKAQLGGSSIGIGLPEDNEEDKEGIELAGSIERPKLNLTLAKDSGFDVEAVKKIIHPVLIEKKELLAKVPEILQDALIKQYDEIFGAVSTQIVEGINKHKDYLSEEQIRELKEDLRGKMKEASKKEKDKILNKIKEANKIFPLTTSYLAWKKVRADKSLEGLNKNIEKQDIKDFLIPHYKNKNIHYIQIGNVKKYNADYKEGEPNKSTLGSPILYGLYIIGDEDPYNLASIGVPSLRKVMNDNNIGYRLELRPGPAGSKKAEWCGKIVESCVDLGTKYDPEALTMRSVNYRVQGRFKQYPNKITEESLDNPSILEEIGDSATEEVVKINNDVHGALEELQNIGKEFLDKISPIENPEGTDDGDPPIKEPEGTDDGDTPKEIITK